jgi:hypothetical protein
MRVVELRGGPVEQGPSGAPQQARPVRSTGRAFALYTTLRLLLFLSVYVVLQVFVQPPLLALGAAVLVSALVSIPLLRPWRTDLTRATQAGAERKAAERVARRARLDET